MTGLRPRDDLTAAFFSDCESPSKLTFHADFKFRVLKFKKSG